MKKDILAVVDTATRFTKQFFLLFRKGISLILVVLELHGSGGHIFADVTDEQAKKADLGVGKCFLAPIGKLEEQKMQKYFGKKCESEFGWLT